MTNYVISSGVESAYALRSGDSLTVLSGGISLGSVVAVGAYESIQAGGASDDDVIRGGIETVASGASISGDRVLSGGQLYLYGTAQDVTVSSGGFAELNLIDGKTQGVTVSSGGVVELSLKVSASQTVIVSAVGASGATVGGVTAKAGATLNITSAQVMSGATLELVAGGRVSNVNVVHGGLVDGRGFLSGGNYDAGVISGVTLSARDEIAGSGLTIASGGVAEALTIIEATVTVDGGGSVSQVLLKDGGKIDVLSSGSAAELTLSGASVNVYGHTQSTSLSGSYEFIWQGGVATATSVLSGGVEYVESRGVASATIVNSGGVAILTAQGIARGVDIEAGGTLDIAVISSGLSLSLSDQPLTETMSLYGVTLQSGSRLGFGALGGLQVKSDATLVIPEDTALSGGLDISAGATVSGAGRLLGDAYVAGQVSGITLDTAPGISESYIIASGGGNADKVTLVAGSLYVNSSGLASGTVVDGNAAGLSVQLGGVADATVVTLGYVTVSEGGSLNGASIASGGVVTGSGLLDGVIYDAGVVSGVGVASGADLIISSGGLAKGGEVNAGGETVVRSGGLLQSGAEAGSVYVQSGGLVVNETVDSGGALTIATGAIVSNAVENAGGQLSLAGAAVFDTPGLVDVGGTLSGRGVIFYAGAGDLELSGNVSKFRGGFVDEAGEIEIASTRSPASSVQFGTDTRTKTLQIDTNALNGTATTLASKLVDFDEMNDVLDLHGLAYVAGATATLRGSVLIVKDGASTVRVKLSGSIASGYSASADGNDRLQVQAISNNAESIIQAMAGFDYFETPGSFLNMSEGHDFRLKSEASVHILTRAQR